MISPTTEAQYRVARPAGNAAAILLLASFLGEAALAKCQAPGLYIPLFIHMGTTGVLLLAIIVYGARRCEAAAVTLRLGGLRRLCVVLMILGLLSALAQESLLSNFVFWVLWALNLVAIWWSLPRLLGSWTIEGRLWLLQLFLSGIVVACWCLHPFNGLQFGRFVGMFANATHAGRFMALASVLFLTQLTTAKRVSRLVLLAMVAALAALVMTRTRASIAAGGIGCAMVLLIALRHQTVRIVIGIQLLVVTLFLGTAVVMTVSPEMYGRVSDREAVLEHFRINAPVEKVLDARAKQWGRGYDDFWTFGLFGKGFLSKFGDTRNTRTIMGIEVPGYDWTTDADPHNMFFTTGQQIGLPAVLVLALLLWTIFRCGGSLPTRAKSLVWGWLVVGLVFGCLDGNWLCTFGSPEDRLTMVGFALMLSAPDTSGVDRNASRRRNPDLRSRLSRTARPRPGLAAGAAHGQGAIS